MLSAFRTITGRNAPSNSRFIFGPAVWLRSLIRPVEGTCICYLDWSGQEVAIAAYLSGDRAMIAAYETGDPYLGFAVQAGLAPEGVTKETHGAIRDQCKILFLGIGYGMSEEGLARRLNCQPAYARELLTLHRQTYTKLWAYLDGAVDTGEQRGWLQSVFGWPLLVTPATRWRTIQNFPIQSAGSEMLRLACIFGTEMGLRIAAPIHDAVLLEAPAGPDGWHEIAAMRMAMAKASRHVLGGAEVRTEVKVVTYPDRYSDKRGREMWATIVGLLAKLETVRTGTEAVRAGQ
jgi:DNA polymerase I-like protein with 3'-5' exonuclease and polymerase domains